jgi:hypothetical protein
MFCGYRPNLDLISVENIFWKTDQTKGKQSNFLCSNVLICNLYTYILSAEWEKKSKITVVRQIKFLTRTNSEILERYYSCKQYLTWFPFVAITVNQKHGTLRAGLGKQWYRPTRATPPIFDSENKPHHHQNALYLVVSSETLEKSSVRKILGPNMFARNIMRTIPDQRKNRHHKGTIVGTTWLLISPMIFISPYLTINSITQFFFHIFYSNPYTNETFNTSRKHGYLLSTLRWSPSTSQG